MGTRVSAGSLRMGSMSTSVTAMGMTLMTNTHRQLARSVSTPPMRGPARKAADVHAVQMPIAFACVAPRWVLMMSASELGTSSAPATPCAARATMSSSAVGARPHAIEVTPKPMSPMRRMATRPKRSLSEPASRMSAPRVMRYASTTHCCTGRPPPSSSVMAGRATLMTVPSRNATKAASIATASARRLRVFTRTSQSQAKCK